MNRVISKYSKALFNSVSFIYPMTSIIMMLFVVSFFSSAQDVVLSETSDLYASKSLPIKIKANDDFMLSGDYFMGANMGGNGTGSNGTGANSMESNRSGGVIVLHDCEHKRSEYRVLAQALAQQGLHTLLVDLRGYGDSVSPVYSRDEAKSKAIDIVDFQSEMVAITGRWTDDLLAVYQFLASKIDKNKGVAVVASGCSAAYTVALAGKIQLNSIVMITPKMAYNDKERYKNLIDIPNYFIVSVNHQDSYGTAQELFAWNGEKHSKMQIFKGTGHDYQLIYRQKNLADDIALWVKSNID